MPHCTMHTSPGATSIRPNSVVTLKTPAPTAHDLQIVPHSVPQARVVEVINDEGQCSKMTLDNSCGAFGAYWPLICWCEHRFRLVLELAMLWDDEHVAVCIAEAGVPHGLIRAIHVDCIALLPLRTARINVQKLGLHLI